MIPIKMKGVQLSPSVALMSVRSLRKDSFKAVGEQFRVQKYSSVSSVIERLKFRKEKDRHLDNRQVNFTGRP